MRIFEFDNDMTRLAEAVEAWIELSHSPEDIKMILNHRFSQQFKTTSAKTAYRVVFADYEAFKETGKVSLPNREDGFVAYSLASSWGASARDDFDYNGDMIRFKKKIQAGSVLLNFSALASALRKSGFGISNVDEKEVWLPTTEYYTTFITKEFIDAELSDGTIIRTRPVKVTADMIGWFNHWMKFNISPESAAENLGVPLSDIYKYIEAHK